MKARECAVCGWVSRDGVELPGWCERCRGRTAADVADLPEFYRALAAVMTPGAAGEQQRVGGSRTPPLPFRVDVANLRGPATAGELPGGDNGGPLSIGTVLAVARILVRETCGLPDESYSGIPDTGRQVDRDARFLIAWLPRYAEYVADPEELAALVEQIHDARQRAWHALGYGAHKVFLGPCPYVDPYEKTGRACGRELWIDPVMADSVTCRDCGTRWDRRYFLWLRRVGEETG
jgi:hypothetical protein